MQGPTVVLKIDILPRLHRTLSSYVVAETEPEPVNRNGQKVVCMHSGQGAGADTAISTGRRTNERVGLHQGVLQSGTDPEICRAPVDGVRR